MTSFSSSLPCQTVVDNRLSFFSAPSRWCGACGVVGVHPKWANGWRSCQLMRVKRNKMVKQTPPCSSERRQRNGREMQDTERQVICSHRSLAENIINDMALFLYRMEVDVSTPLWPRIKWECDAAHCSPIDEKARLQTRFLLLKAMCG